MGSMSAQGKFLHLMAGLLAVLVLASLVGWALARRRGPAGPSEVVRNLNDRIRAWWVMVGVLALAFGLGPTVTIALFAGLSCLALREFLCVAGCAGPGAAQPLRPWMGAVLAGLVAAQYGLIHADWYGLFSVFIPVYAFLLLPSLSVLDQRTEGFLQRTAQTQWAVMVTIYCVSHVPALLLLRIPGYEGQNALLLFYLMLVVQMSDVLQYVFGKLWGRTRIAPAVSPSKTVEGFVGGALSATALGAAMWWITPFSPWQAAALSAVAVAMGFLGGLVLSAVKRSAGAKDWGSLIRGHGGVMDRLDSISFAAPVFFHLTRYFFA